MASFDALIQSTPWEFMVDVTDFGSTFCGVNKKKKKKKPLKVSISHLNICFRITQEHYTQSPDDKFNLHTIHAYIQPQ